MPSRKQRIASYYDAGDAIEFLRGQHREIERLLEALSRATFATARSRIVEEVGDLLAVHMALEERVFYPGLLQDDFESSPGAVVLAVEDHRDLKRRLADLLAAEAEGVDFEVAARRLRDDSATHIAAEERLYPRLRRRLSPTRLRRLEYEMRVLEFQMRTDSAPRRLVADEAFASALA